MEALITKNVHCISCIFCVILVGYNKNRYLLKNSLKISINFHILINKMH